MNPQDILRYVDSLHREKNIDTELVFSAIEAALQTAAKRQYGEEADITVQLDRENGRITAHLDGEALGDDQIGRIGAQTAKQVIIQKVREAERDSLMAEYRDQIGDTVAGIIGRADGGVATVNLGNVEAILPRSEQIPGETLHAGERVRAVVFEVKATGNRVRVVLSRTRPQLVQRLFEQEIPELSEGVISINSISREPGYRSKVAVSSVDSQVDPIAVCVGYRGSRIKAVREELAGEHIDVVRYSEDPEVLIPNALQPAEVEQVLLCDMIGRAIVLVQEDQLSLAIGRRGQNVRLASKLCGWDIEIMTGTELEEQIERAVEAFSHLEGMTPEISQILVEQGYLSYDDLSVIEPDAFMEMSGLTAEQVDLIVETAEEKAEEAEEAAAQERQVRRDRERLQKEAAEAGVAEPDDDPLAEDDSDDAQLEADVADDGDIDAADAEASDAEAEDQGASQEISESSEDSAPAATPEVSVLDGEPESAELADAPEADASEADASEAEPSRET
ncbi:MAG: transcription termination factor NusA [Planctomycetales bacterium]|nr:transcription termination factor NusA [Planctomycetales bacterium]